MIVVLVIGFGLYLIAIIWLISGFLKLPKKFPGHAEPKTTFSVIIPFRNEAENIPNLIQSLSQIQYPKQLFEVLFVNDASEDEGEEILKNLLKEMDLNHQTLQNERKSQSPKKDAISVGIENASHEWILTTDADCRVPEKWLDWYDRFIQQEQPYMVCGPVLFHHNKTLLGYFQFLDGLSLQLVAMGSFGWKSPLLSNGANFGYLKEAFHKVEGFKGNDHIASGDDIFLLEKMKKAFPNKLRFLYHPEATVTTQSETSWKNAISQRIRWASKTTQQKSAGSKLLGGIVFLANLLFIVSIICYFLVFPEGKWYFMFPVIKMVIDMFALGLMAGFFKKTYPVHFVWIVGMIYPFATLWIVVNSLRGSYTWKGRTHSK